MIPGSSFDPHKHKETPDVKVGDIVTFKLMSHTFKGIVTAIWNDKCFVLRRNGETVMALATRFTKTGEHIDISNILERIKED